MSHKNKGAFVGIGMALYGVLSLAFQILNTRFDSVALAIWAFLNPLFVAYTLTGRTAGSLSLLVDFSSCPLAVATLMYWLWPTLFVVVGVVVSVYAGGKH